MDWVTFLIRLIEALAWPVAAVTIVWVFRQQVRQLLSLVRKLKAGPVEAEFEREVREVQEISQETVVGRTTIGNEKKPDPIKTKLIELTKQHPRAAILEAWRGVEVAVKRAALQNGIGSPPDTSSPLKAVSALVQAKVVGPDDLALFHVLRGLRNQAAHIEGFEPSGDAALVYVHLARQLELRLLKLANVARQLELRLLKLADAGLPLEK